MAEREQDEFKRIQITDEVAHYRTLVTQYEQAIAFYRERIETRMHGLGELDERLRRIMTSGSSVEELMVQMFEAMRVEHEADIANARARADECAALGDFKGEAQALAYAQRLDNFVKPWENKKAS